MLDPGGGIDQQGEAGAVRVVDNEMTGDKVMIPLDFEIIGFFVPDRLDRDDSVPIDIGAGQTQ